MSKALFLASAKRNLPIYLFVNGMLFIYVISSLGMYDPEGAGTMHAMMEMLPEGLIKSMGFDLLGTDLLGYLAGYLYGFIYLMFPLIFVILAANQLIAKHVETGSMAYLLTTPNSRVRIATTQAVYFVAAIGVLFTVQSAAIMGTSAILFPGSLEIGGYLKLNLVTFLITTCVAGISFLASAAANDTRRSIAIGGGIPIVFFLIKLISEISDDLASLRYATVYGYLDVERILSPGPYWWLISIILAAVTATLFGVAISIFNRKSLAI